MEMELISKKKEWLRMLTILPEQDKQKSGERLNTLTRPAA